MKRHIWDIEFQNFPIQRKFLMAAYCLYNLSSGLIKLSVLLFYRRLGKGLVSRAFRWIMILTFIMVLAYTISFCIIPIVMCNPVSAYWDQVDFRVRFGPKKYDFTCINEGADVVANGVASTVTDFIVAILPTILCWKLQIPMRQKIALYSIFAVSYSTVALGSMRVYTSYHI